VTDRLTVQRFRDSWNERIGAVEFAPTFTVPDLVFNDGPNGRTAFAEFPPSTFLLRVVADDHDRVTLAQLKVDEAPTDPPELDRVMALLMLVFIGAANPTLSGDQQRAVLGELRIDDSDRRLMKDIEGQVSRGPVTYSAVVTQRAPRWSTSLLTAAVADPQTAVP
jgi:hypothetical protein